VKILLQRSLHSGFTVVEHGEDSTRTMINIYIGSTYSDLQNEVDTNCLVGYTPLQSGQNRRTTIFRGSAYQDRINLKEYNLSSQKEIYVCFRLPQILQ
jgi:hypothetical protein